MGIKLRVFPCHYQNVRAHNVEYLTHLEDVSVRFAQIVLVNNNHWLVISKKLTKDPDDIEVFDSMYQTFFEANRRLNMISLETSHLAWAFPQIKPGAKSISYVKVQQQLSGYNGCGPLSLSYFSSIVRKINPHSFQYQHEQILRTTVRRIVETGTLENLIPRMTEKSIRIPKSIIRTYKRASGTNFYLQ